jgi:hypothetical protein
MATPGLPNFDANTTKNLSPEQNMAKQKENSRTGGYGGGRKRDFNFEDAPLAPIPEKPEPYQYAPESHGVTLELTPDANDKDMEELLGILNTKGLDAVFKELDRISNPHLEDDFHRLLVQLKRQGQKINGLDPKSPLAKALDFQLIKISVPEPSSSLSEVCEQMISVYQAILPFVGLPSEAIFFKDWRYRKAIQKEHITMEIAVSSTDEAACFYLAAPRSRMDLIEKQIFATFPGAQISEAPDDYNIFNQFGASAVAYTTLYRPAPLAIKTYDAFTSDPINQLLTSMARISKEGEGVAFQISVAPAGEYYMKRFMKLLDDMRHPKMPPSDIFRKHRYLFRNSWIRRHAPNFIGTIMDFFSSEEKKSQERDVDNMQVSSIEKKMKHIIMGTNIRIATSARTDARAQALLKDFELVLNQYDDPQGNRFKLRFPASRAEERDLFRQFIFRLFDRGPIEGVWKMLYLEFFEKIHSPLMYYSRAMPMSLGEIATMFHLAIAGGTLSREADTAGGKYAMAYPGLPSEGILLGRNKHAGVTTDVRMQMQDRMRHLYTIGQTGTGKTNFLKNLIIQDIERGDGVCFIDPHGVDVLEILSRIPKERQNDVIYFDPAYTERPMGLNMLEYDPRFPEQKTFVVDELFKIFQKLYGQVPEAFGPIFEQYFRNATLLVLEDPETGSTLLDISRVLSDEDFRHLKISRCRNPVVAHFWEDIAERVSGEGALKNIVPYITSKFDIFIANEIMRPIVGQQRSAFNFKDIMDNKKIFLVNLSKGRLGDVNANLIGLVLVGKILMEALARDVSQNPPAFYLYLDEFQNITTDSISIILSEARKFRLSMTMAHQFIGQLYPKIRDAVFGNVGSMAVFRVGPDDVEFLARQLQPIFEAKDLLKTKNFQAAMRLLNSNSPFPPFTLETLPFTPGDSGTAEAMKQLSYQRFGRPREAVEAEIREKYAIFKKEK